MRETRRWSAARAAHHIVDQIVKSNGQSNEHVRLRSESNGNAAGAAAVCPGANFGKHLRVPAHSDYFRHPESL
jgi:hypothetical protein